MGQASVRGGSGPKEEASGQEHKEKQRRSRSQLVLPALGHAAFLQTGGSSRALGPGTNLCGVVDTCDSVGPVSQGFPSTLSLGSGWSFIKAFLAGHTVPVWPTSMPHPSGYCDHLLRSGRKAELGQIRVKSGTEWELRWSKSTVTESADGHLATLLGHPWDNENNLEES